MRYAVLPNGVSMPAVSIIPCQRAGDDTSSIIQNALKAGYNSIYMKAGNSGLSELAEILRTGHISREDLFLIISIPPLPSGGKDFRQEVLTHIHKLQTSYLDLVLLDSPGEGCTAAFQEMEKLYEEKKLHAIGVQSFRKEDLIHITTCARIWPMICELDPTTADNHPSLLRWLKKYGILLMTSSLPCRDSQWLTSHPVLKQLAEKYSCTPAALVLNWIISTGAVTVLDSQDIDFAQPAVKFTDIRISQADRKLIWEIIQQHHTFM